MADTTTTASRENTATREKAPAHRSESALETARGKTSIADAVVTKIAGIAAREVNGVNALGGGAARVVGSLRERIPGASLDLSQGVSVEVGDTQAAVDLDIVAEYGVSIAELAAGVRRNVIAAIERMTGLEVTEVNITVHDIHLPGSDDDTADDTPARVQ